MHKTSARPLALIYAGLIVYASLYPFEGWRSQGIVPWAFLYGAWPQYWSGFDVAINIGGYVPLGFLLTLGALRSGSARFAVLSATVLAAGLSLAMESLQSYLPVRVPSQSDLLLNTLGACAGALLGRVLERLGVVAHWGRLRSRWFVTDARGALVLLALWPVALLFPPAVPFGLGQVLERLEALLVEQLIDTPFLEWLPVRDVELQPLVPAAEMLCVLLGASVPCLLAYCIVPSVWRRGAFALVVFACGVLVSALSAALSFGPQHAWAWLSLPVQIGLLVALLVLLALVWVPRRVAAALLLLALGVYLSLLNQAPASAYFAQTLAAWEQGEFIRFHGLAQWLGWLWPYMTLAYVLVLLSGRTSEN